MHVPKTRIGLRRSISTLPPELVATARIATAPFENGDTPSRAKKSSGKSRPQVEARLHKLLDLSAALADFLMSLLTVTGLRICVVAKQTPKLQKKV